MTVNAFSQSSACTSYTKTDIRLVVRKRVYAVSEPVSINPLLNKKSNLCKNVLRGAKRFFSMLSSSLVQLDGTLPNFDDSTIKQSVLILKDYVINGVQPASQWSDCAHSLREATETLYRLLDLTQHELDYRHDELSISDRYFCSFVLSAVNRFRVDANWHGEICKIHCSDSTDNYFTRGDLALLLGVTYHHFDRLLAQMDTWLNDNEVLAVLRDENGETLAEYLSKFSGLDKLVQSAEGTLIKLSDQLTIQWKEKFKTKFSKDDFDTAEDAPYIHSTFDHYPELEPYTYYRVRNKPLKLVYPYKTVLCMLNLFAVKGYYIRTHYHKIH